MVTFSYVNHIYPQTYKVEDYIEGFNSWSSTSEDFLNIAEILGTKWNSTYSYDGKEYNHTLEIGSEPKEDTNNNKYYVNCKLDNIAGVGYTDRYGIVCIFSPDGGKKFEHYTFKNTSQSSVTGTFILYDTSNSSNSYITSFQLTKTGTSDTDVSESDSSSDDQNDTKEPPKYADPDTVFKFVTEDDNGKEVSGCFIQNFSW